MKKMLSLLLALMLLTLPMAATADMGSQLVSFSQTEKPIRLTMTFESGSIIKQLPPKYRQGTGDLLNALEMTIYACIEDGCTEGALNVNGQPLINGAVLSHETEQYIMTNLAGELPVRLTPQDMDAISRFEFLRQLRQMELPEDMIESFVTGMMVEETDMDAVEVTRFTVKIDPDGEVNLNEMLPRIAAFLEENMVVYKLDTPMPDAPNAVWVKEVVLNAEQLVQMQKAFREDIGAPEPEALDDATPSLGSLDSFSMAVCYDAENAPVKITAVGQKGSSSQMKMLATIKRDGDVSDVEIGLSLTTVENVKNADKENGNGVEQASAVTQTMHISLKKDGKPTSCLVRYDSGTSAPIVPLEFTLTEENENECTLSLTIRDGLDMEYTLNAAGRFSGNEEDPRAEFDLEVWSAHEEERLITIHLKAETTERLPVMDVSNALKPAEMTEDEYNLFSNNGMFQATTVMAKAMPILPRSTALMLVQLMMEGMFAQ